MRKFACRWISLFMLVCAMAAGCGKEEAPASGQSVESPRLGPADSPDVAVLAVLEGMRKNHPEALWDFLPETYEHDIDDLVHVFAQRMDRQLWARGIAVLRKLVDVLKTKREFLAADMSRVAELVDTLLSGDLADLERLKAFDGRRFLATTGALLVGQLHELGQDLGGMLRIKKVTLMRIRGDTATVELKTANDPESQFGKLADESGSTITFEREFVRVEGKWIPKDLADGWIEQIGQTRARLSLLSPENLGEMKPQILSLLTAVEGVLDRLAAARNHDEFRAALGEADVQLAPFKLLVAAWLGGTSDADAMGPAETQPEDSRGDEPIEFATVVVTGMLDDDAQDALRARLQALADDRNQAECEFTGDDESTTFKVGPVGDIEEFAKRLTFLKVTSIDPKTRTITAEKRK
jgi:hypothetical protein